MTTLNITLHLHCSRVKYSILSKLLNKTYDSRSYDTFCFSQRYKQPILFLLYVVTLLGNRLQTDYYWLQIELNCYKQNVIGYMQNVIVYRQNVTGYRQNIMVTDNL